MNIRILLCLIIVLGVVLAGIGLYSLFSKSQAPAIVSLQTNTESHTSDAKPQNSIIKIPFKEYVSGEWDEYGVGYDPDPRVTCLWMRKTGYINYRVNLTTDPIQSPATLTVKLSSELDSRTSNDLRDSSDVTLSVNGIEQKTWNVIPDDLIGQNYTWTIPANVFKADNTITFSVKKDAKNKNGIAIYSPIQIRFY